MTYLEEAEALKAECKRKIKKIMENTPPSQGRDSYASKKCHEVDLWFSHEIEKLKEKYNITFDK